MLMSCVNGMLQTDSTGRCYCLIRAHRRRLWAALLSLTLSSILRLVPCLDTCFLASRRCLQISAAAKIRSPLPFFRYLSLPLPSAVVSWITVDLHVWWLLSSRTRVSPALANCYDHITYCLYGVSGSVKPLLHCVIPHFLLPHHLITLRKLTQQHIPITLPFVDTRYTVCQTQIHWYELAFLDQERTVSCIRVHHVHYQDHLVLTKQWLISNV